MENITNTVNKIAFWPMGSSPERLGELVSRVPGLQIKQEFEGKPKGWNTLVPSNRLHTVLAFPPAPIREQAYVTIDGAAQGLLLVFSAAADECASLWLCDAGAARISPKCLSEMGAIPCAPRDPLLTQLRRNVRITRHEPESQTVWVDRYEGLSHLFDG